jgi:hypothetical protein
VGAPGSGLVVRTAPPSGISNLKTKIRLFKIGSSLAQIESSLQGRDFPWVPSNLFRRSPTFGFPQSKLSFLESNFLQMTTEASRRCHQSFFKPMALEFARTQRCFAGNQIRFSCFQMCKGEPTVVDFSRLSVSVKLSKSQRLLADFCSAFPLGDRPVHQ